MPVWSFNLEKKDKITYRLVIFLTLAAFFVWPKIISAQIIINEIMYDLPGTDNHHEWVELYNNGSASIDLTDYKINDGDTVTNHILNIPPKNNGRGSIILNAGEYLLLADDAATIVSDLPSYSGTIIDTVINLSNTGATLKLLDKDGLEISAVSYTKDLGAAGNGRTLEFSGAALKESTLDDGTPGRANSVLNSSGPTPSAAPSSSPVASSPVATATATPSPSAIVQSFDYSKDILINEFLPAPGDGEKEWVELFNAGSTVINLAGWQIDDGDNSTAPQIIPENTTIYANGFLVISFNKSTLNNDGDKARLLWPDDQVVHAVSYSKGPQGQSVAKFGTSWLWTNQPTPGQTNKKSATKNSESVATITTAEKIDPLEENVSVPISPSPNKKTPAPQTIVNSTPISSTDSQPTDQPENINLSAAIGDPIKKEGYKIGPILSLAGVIILSAMTASALVYFRRQKQIDSEGMDD